MLSVRLPLRSVVLNCISRSLALSLCFRMRTHSPAFSLSFSASNRKDTRSTKQALFTDFELIKRTHQHVSSALLLADRLSPSPPFI
jgi:hypothetical protein